MMIHVCFSPFSILKIKESPQRDKTTKERKMKKTLFIALVGALALSIAGAQDSSTTTTTKNNSAAYNWGYTYGTQGNNQCGTTTATGEGAGNPKSQINANKKLEDCNKGYTDGYNATHNNK
ncbi:MAG: hypothetical protein K2M50_10155 [Treponemataceae bacterium]|nr:hypothetical protein [Treponemataceae bacterium]